MNIKDKPVAIKPIIYKEDVFRFNETFKNAKLSEKSKKRFLDMIKENGGLKRAN